VFEYYGSAVATGSDNHDLIGPLKKGDFSMTPQLRTLLVTAIVPLAMCQAPVALGFSAQSHVADAAQRFQASPVRKQRPISRK
jgi:hypothetical protein